jgi:RND superfamily putative drug exporter
MRPRYSPKIRVGGAQFVAGARRCRITNPAARLAGTEISRKLAGLPYVTMLQSAWTGRPQAASELVSRDGAGLVVASIAGDENTVQRHASEIMSLLPKSFDGVTVKLGGD